jgi:flagellar P-ring protein FlgI
MNSKSITCIFVTAAMLLAAAPSWAARIGDLCDVQGVRGNSLKGIGIVVGLAGTGDNADAAIRAQERMLKRLTIDVDSVNELASDNAAICIVTATLPAFVKEGTRIDVQVSSLYDAESLEGGILMETQLLGQDGRVYAVAQGPISTGGMNVDAGGTQARINFVTVGRIPNGAYVEREVPSTITDGERIILQLRNPDFVTADNIRQAIDERYGPQAADAFGAGAISVKIPDNRNAELVSFIAEVQRMEVEANQVARVVINERTGTIVVGGQVIIKPCQVAHGNIVIQIARTPVVSQPAPFSEGETVVDNVTDIEVIQDVAHLMPVEGTSAADVADALNKLKVTPRDMIAIFQALREAGALQAELEIM